MALYGVNRSKYTITRLNVQDEQNFDGKIWTRQAAASMLACGFQKVNENFLLEGNLKAPYPKEIVHFVADYLPECVGLWATLWDKANDDGCLLLTNKIIREDLCLTPTIVVNRLRKLGKSGLVDMFAMGNGTIRVEMVSEGMSNCDIEDDLWFN